MKKDLAIVVTSGTLKGAFGQGVLSAFETNKILPGAYVCASSSVVSCCLAIEGTSNSKGLQYWKEASAQSASMNMSDIVLNSIERYGGSVKDRLFGGGESPRLMIVVSKVNNAAAAEETQGPNAKKLGRRIIREMAVKRKSEWVDNNLTKCVFDTKDTGGLRLMKSNFDQVAYASTRMMHAWDIPAEIDGEAYVDASYLCTCPVEEAGDAGFNSVIVIDVEPGQTYVNFLTKSGEVTERSINGVHLSIIKPDIDLKDIGVEYLSASVQGCERAYELGLVAGKKFIDNNL